MLGYIRGNELALIGWLGIAWIVGGFMEELLFRGFLLNRIAGIFRSKRAGLSFGIAGQAVLFGSLHMYQGAFGFVYASIFAVISGIAYVLFGRNLWPLILVHGTWNSVGMIGIYLS